MDMKRFFRKNKNSRKEQNGKYLFLDLSNEASKNEESEQMEMTVPDKEKEYRNLFSDIVSSSGQRKAVYVSRKTHRFVSEIVQSLDVENINIGAFVDTVVSLHIKENEDVLRSIYYNPRKDDMFSRILEERSND